jgi:hypothetical protein
MTAKPDQHIRFSLVAGILLTGPADTQYYTTVPRCWLLDLLPQGTGTYKSDKRFAKKVGGDVTRVIRPSAWSTIRPGVTRKRIWSKFSE